MLAPGPHVDHDAFDAIGAEHIHGTGHQLHAAEDLMHDQRIEGVELQLAFGGGPIDRHIHTEHRETALVHTFGNHRIHLRRHDAGTGLSWRHFEITEACARP